MIKTIFFDWGDTLMVDSLQNSRPMATWPEVIAVPGAKQALEALSPTYSLVVVTNAQESDSGQVRAALARVNLDLFISRIFTAFELGLTKQDGHFYPAVLEALHLDQPDQALMVGDGYPGDIHSAKQSGLRAVWYNPRGEASPTGVPVHDAEIRDLAELPGLLQHSLLPDIPVCLGWLQAEGTKPNIVAHSQEVARAAYLMAVWLRGTGEQIDPVLTHRGGLLHDLDKLTSRTSGEAHGERSHRLLKERGEPAMAEIARRHIIGNIGGQLGPRSWEEKLVFYADKLVEGDQLTLFSHRLAALTQRYPDYKDQMLESQSKVEALEADICSRLGLSPYQLLERLRAETRQFV